MEKMLLNPIGKITVRDDETVILLDQQYIPSLEGLGGFSHLQILWWFDGCDNEQMRDTRTEAAPYQKGPEHLGTFATRSPQRPNPIALTTAYVTYIDDINGVIGLAYIDANEGTPVLDIKPYTPSLDRVEHPQVPAWCAHWPACNEDAGAFDWESEFNF